VVRGAAERKREGARRRYGAALHRRLGAETPVLPSREPRRCIHHYG